MTFKYHVVLPNNCVSRVGKYLFFWKTYVTYIILKKDDFDFSSKYFSKFLMMQFMDY